MTVESLIGLAVLVGLVVFFRWNGHRKNQRLKGQWEAAIGSLEANDIESAEAGFRKCIAEAPIFLHARWFLAETLARQGRLDEAEQELQTAVDFEPRNAENHLNLGMFRFVHRQDHPAAIAALGEAVRLDPDLRAKIAHEPRLRGLLQDPAFDAVVTAND